MILEQEWERTFASLVRDSNVLREDDSDITRIQAQLVALTPMVPVRTVSLLRCWKKMDEGLVAVVDVSVSSSQELHCNRLPFGVLLEKLGKGTTRVTWVEHYTFTIQTMMKNMVGDMLEVISPIIPDGWRLIAVCQLPCDLEREEVCVDPEWVGQGKGRVSFPEFHAAENRKGGGTLVPSSCSSI
ncbi:hypothetical protein Bca4012_036027 [Brassica carinata]